MGLLDAISPTPRNKVLGLLSDLFGAVDAYANNPQTGMPMGKANPVLGLLSDAFGIGGTARTLDRLSYGEPITNIGKANVPLIPQDTADAAMLGAAALPMLSRGALKASDAAVRAITRNPEATATRVADYASQMAPISQAASWRGNLPRNNMNADWLDGLISSQKYLDRATVAKKIKSGDFEVQVSPVFSIDGKEVRAIQDGHHSLEAAIRSGNKPRFVEQTQSMNDRVNLINNGNIDQFLEASWIDSPWYYFNSKRELF